jgi:4-methylaminobutanoate oxidase (formaldehyde-forming)
VRGLFVGCGFNSVGIASAGGAGRALAEWIAAGGPQDDLTAVDVRRFGPLQNDVGFLRARVVETLGLHYAVPWPNREPVSGRPQRTSPLHDRLAARGALFGTRNGWERPLVFGPTDLDYTWDKPAWLEASAAEHRACRAGVAVFDQTSFSKYAVSGAGALELLQWVCAADVDVPVDACVYTPWLNERGCYEADVTVTRTGPQDFLVVSSAATTHRDLDWLDRHRRPRAQVGVRDLTEELAVLGVMGPASPDLIAPLTPAALGDDDFPFATSRRIEVGGVPLRATRMTYVGELGWELYVPVEDAALVYERLMADGRAADAGYSAIESLRLEKGYRAFGRDLLPDVTPREAGLVFATALKGGKDFLGRAALEASGPPRRRLVSFVAEDPEAMLWGGELLRRYGEPAGQVTSAAWCATVGAAAGLAWIRRTGVTAELLAEGGFSVDAGGRDVPVRVGLRAPLR